MRHLMTSFLAMHWAAFFALLGYLCIDAGRIDAALAMFGANTVHAAAGADLAAAPAAVAFFLVAALFCWLLMEASIGRTDLADGVLKITFVAGGAVLSTLLIGCAIHGAGGSSQFAAYLTALVASYMAVLGERQAAAVTSPEARAAIRTMAREAASMSLLDHILDRHDLRRDQ